MNYRALFVHDHIFCRSKDGDVYSPGGFPKELWAKYTNIFESLAVIGRCQSISDEISGKHVLSSLATDPIEFIFVDSISTPAKLLKNMSAAYSAIEKEVIRSDVIIARLPSENGLAAIKFAKKHKKVYSIEVVGCVWDGLYNYGTLMAKLYAPLAYFRMRKAVCNSKNLLYVTSDFLQKRYPNLIANNIVNASNVNISLINKGFDLYKYNKPIVIGMIGNYKTNYKGIDTALKAMAELKSLDFPFEFRVLGNGNPDDYSEFIDKFNIKNNVRFYDPLPSGKPVLDWLSLIDIYIQPSRQEGLPRSLIEALSCGKICIGSQAGGIPELLEKDFVHKTNSSSSLFKKILMAASLDDCERKIVLDDNMERIKQYDSLSLNSRRNVFYSKVKESCANEIY